MFKNSVSLMVVLTLFLIACGEDVDYLGESYSPISDVDVYFSEDDVSEDYRKMGDASVKGDDLEKLREKLRKKAGEEGADGIIYTGFEPIKTGEVERTDAVGNTITQDTRTYRATAIFIKYTKNL